MNSAIQIKSYIKKPQKKISNIYEIIDNPKNYFICIDKSKEIIAIRSLLDLNYIEGCIIIIFQNEVLTGFDYWDLVDQLWAYYINMIDDYFRYGFGESYFPDQPIKIRLENAEKPEFLFFSVQVYSLKKYKLPKKEFLLTLLNEAEHFFTRLINLLHLPVDTYRHSLQQIQHLKKSLGKKTSEDSSISN